MTPTTPKNQKPLEKIAHPPKKSLEKIARSPKKSLGKVADFAKSPLKKFFERVFAGAIFYSTIIFIFRTKFVYSGVNLCYNVLDSAK